MLTEQQVREYKAKYLPSKMGVVVPQKKENTISSTINQYSQDIARPQLESGAKVAKLGSEVIGMAKKGDILGAGLKTAVAGGEIVGGAARSALAPVGTTLQKISEMTGKPLLTEGVVKDALTKLEELKKTNPEVGDSIQNLLDVLALGGGAKAEPKVIAGAEKGVDFTKKIVGDIGSGSVGKQIKSAKTTLFGKTAPKNIEQVISEADKSLKSTPAEVLKSTEAVTSKPSLMEKWAGISNDIKNRIAGKQDKLKEYFDVAHARNNFDTLPTPLEYGAKNVDVAVSKMETMLNDTGSNIGKFRKKISTYEATIDDVNRIESSFANQLEKLNLEIKNGTIVQKPGTVTRTSSAGEVKVLNDIYNDLKVVKQNPSLEKLIDLRNVFDQKINFAKSAREASNTLDPLSRNIRKEIANVSAKIVGKSEASNLTKYSDFMDAYNSLRSFTDRKAGAEFLLKQVLSERGGVPREVIQTIKEMTGIDLMDDAVMASIATDLIGNTRQKGLFRQEITKAGLDASKILHGDTLGAIETMIDWGKKGLLNEEKIFLKAAK